MWFFLIFIAVPIAEIAIFMAAGDEIGLLNTLLLCFITAVIGGFLVKKQGLEALMKGQNNLNRGIMPVQEMFDGFCLIASGIMLCTPGFLTDSIGFLLLIPAVRVYLKNAFVKSGKFKMHDHHTPYGSPHQESPDIIEGQYKKLDDNEK